MPITIVNTGSQNASLQGAALPFVRAADGGLLTLLIDGSGRMKLPTGVVAPGQEVTSLTAYALPATAADSFSVEFAYGSGTQRKNVVWSGPAG
ncbi:hypothetical protein ABTX81_35140 [Kitasatospora sp. NPDC097605]|uniref:hypothetical protein n=1 Tax=Kitasatospora sp. NPDC097605 TaxID=3157226 RepID=UPI00331DD739